MVVNIHAPYPPMRNMADKVIEAVKSGAVRHFFLVGGCGGTRPGRSCCMQFVKQTPADTVVLILACGKFLFNDLDLGTVSRSDRTNYVMCCMALLSLRHFAPKSNHKRPDYIFHSLAKDQHFYIHGGISKSPCPITAALVSGRSE